MKISLVAQKFYRHAVIWAMTVVLVTPFSVFAEPVAIDETPDETPLTNDAGTIPPGTPIEIPEVINGKKIRVLNADGTVNLDKSIYNWINQGDRIDRGAPGENPARNSARYLYPALIHKDGKTVKYYVSIDDLGYTQKTGELFAIREAPLTRPETAEQLLHSRVAQQSTAVLNPDKLKPGQTLPPGSLDVLLRPPPNNKSSHLEAVGDCVACRMAQMPFSFVHLTNTLAPSMQSADRAFNQTTKENSRSVNATYTNFARTCGFKLDDFLPEIRRQASQVPIEPETLLGIMTQESKGNCWAINNNDGGSSGLFQINKTSGTRFPGCSNAQRQLIVNAHGNLEALRRGPLCLNNPVINIQESVRVLQQKSNALFKANPRGFDERVLQGPAGQAMRDKLLLSAYNGGEKWVLEAKSQLELFNQRNHTQLSPYNWENLRVFYFTNNLQNNAHQYFGQKVSNRLQSYTVINLSYAENIAGRDASTENQTLHYIWQKQLE